jgi:amidase/aspartyl-tRNA(Asn)/glutamyl-tRNA(Gln) amidotransferase subunit A
MPPDLRSTLAALQAGRLDPLADFDARLDAARSPACAHAFVRLFPEQGRAAAAAVRDLRGAGGPLPPLGGLAVSVKDLFDVAGQPTTGGSRLLAEARPAAAATQDAPAVARLRAAGAAFIGHTNLSEFAFSGVGINPHHGTPANPATLALDPAPRVPGGSTSGGAVSVSTGAAWAALGSDTAGSIRIPAALQGLVGFKNTQRLVPREACLPLSPTLDTACAITRSVGDAVLLHEVLAARQVVLARRPLSALRLAVPQGALLERLDPPVAQAFERTLARLAAAGARLQDITLPDADVLTQGGFSAAESWAWHRHDLAEHEALYDPRVARRIRRGDTLSAADYLDLQAARTAWIAQVQRAIAPFDALLSPTVPLVAPPLQPLLDSDERFFETNGLLLRNTMLANLLDGCALSMPCHAQGDWPVGLMVWSGALQDDTVLDVSLAIEAALAPHTAGA